MRKLLCLLLVVLAIPTLACCKEKKKEHAEVPTAVPPATEQVTPPATELVPGDDTEGEGFGAFVPFA